MNFKLLSNQTLLLKTKELVACERKIIVDILNHLKEIERRLLHLELGYGSLFEYAVTELKYSESQAQRRISAMRLLKDLPSLETKIQVGSLNLTTASRIQSFIYQSKKVNKPLDMDQKQKLVENLENKSSRECELEFLKLLPESINLKEKERVLSEDFMEVKITIRSDLKSKLTKVKSLLSHKNPNPSYAELLELMCDLIIQQKEPGAKSKSKIEKKEIETMGIERKSQVDRADEVTGPSQSTIGSYSIKKNNVSSGTGKSIQSPALRINAVSKVVTKNSRYIPASVKNEVYMRDKGCCTFMNLKTQRRCTSNHLLQYDHILPFSCNGEASVQNLRLLCFQHHKLVTSKMFKVRI